MWHGNGEANILDGSVFNTQNAIFLIKNGTVEINVDSSELNVADGIILQMMDNDDTVIGMGDFPTMTFNTEFNEEEGYPGIDNDVKYDASAADSGFPGGDMPEGGMPEGEMPEGEAPEGDN